jgi:hemerythrin
VKAIDADHKKMVDLTNELYDAILAGRGRKKLGSLFDRLVEYTSATAPSLEGSSRRT